MRLARVVAVCAVGVVGCRQPNPAFDEQDIGAGSAIASTGSDGSTDVGASESSGLGSSATDAVDDAAASDDTSDEDASCNAAPGASGPCPEACSECVDGVCRIDCIGEQSCKQATLACPPMWPCLVECEGKDACAQASIDCHPARACEVRCRGESGCNQAVIACAEAPCSLQCDAEKDVCKQLRFECGSADSVVQCEGDGQELDLALNDSACACEALGC